MKDKAKAILEERKQKAKEEEERKKAQQAEKELEKASKAAPKQSTTAVKPLPQAKKVDSRGDTPVKLADNTEEDGDDFDQDKIRAAIKAKLANFVKQKMEDSKKDGKWLP